MDELKRPGRGRVVAVRALRGFTLIELLVSVAVIGVLVSLISPGLAKSRLAARSVSCLAKLRNLQLTTRIYADEHRTLPVNVMHLSIPVYDLKATSWRCPEDRQAANTPMSTVSYSSFTYLAPLYMDPPASGMVLHLLKPRNGLRKYENNPKLPLFWDRDENHEKDRNVVYWHGGAERRGWE
ncbi:MAG TPA: type II secretion system protein [Phycisphaerales bacterium]|nr:type II secretion system protein [Phycisphaerales bacterium]